MALNRRNFLSLSGSSALGLVSITTLSACSTSGTLGDQEIKRILGDYLYLGAEHQDLVAHFIEDLRFSPNTTEGPEGTAAILRGERGQGVAERYVIQEFVRFSNYRLWIRRQDQTLGTSLVAHDAGEHRELEDLIDLNDPLAP